MIEAIKKTYGLSVRVLVCELGISYATLMRWKRRLSRGTGAGRANRGRRRSGRLTSANSKRASGNLSTAAGAAVGRVVFEALLLTPSPDASSTE